MNDLQISDLVAMGYDVNSPFAIGPGLLLTEATGNVGTDDQRHRERNYTY